MMRLICFAIFVGCLAAKSAFAGSGQNDWSGFYVGGNVGGAWLRSVARSTFTCPDGVGCPYLDPINWAAFARSGTSDGSSSAVTAGVQGGHLWQFAQVVMGVEFDFNWLGLGISRSAGGTVPGAPATRFLTSTSIDSEWMFTSRGRLGWAPVPSTLLYVTGGLALSEIRAANAFADNFVLTSSGSASNRNTKAGWVAGAGAEWLVYGNWTAKVEYLHVDLGSTSTVSFIDFPNHVNATSNLLITQREIAIDIVRLGLNFRIDVPQR